MTETKAARELARAAEKLHLYLDTAEKMNPEALLDLLWKIEIAMNELKSRLAKPGFLITKELAARCGVNQSRIRQLAPLLESRGLARKESGTWRFRRSAVDAVQAMPGPGRPKSEPPA